MNQKLLGKSIQFLIKATIAYLVVLQSYQFLGPINSFTKSDSSRMSVGIPGSASGFEQLGVMVLASVILVLMFYLIFKKDKALMFFLIPFWSFMF